MGDEFLDEVSGQPESTQHNNVQEYHQEYSNHQPEYQNQYQQYQQPTQNPQQEKPKSGPYPGKGLSIASMVLGILSILFIFTGYLSIMAVVLGAVGLSLGIAGKKKTRNDMATAGIVLSIISLAIGSLVFISCIICTACLVNTTIQTMPNWPDFIPDSGEWSYTL